MKKILIGICGIALLPQLVLASPIIRGGENISIDVAQKLEGDFYGFASAISISGTADEDVYVAGGKVTINGPVAKDLSILGGTVSVHGDVGDDVRIIGADVELAHSVKGDVLVIGGSLTVLSTATIEGDILFFGNNLHIEGIVGGTIHGSSESIRIDATVGGDIEYTAAESFVLGDKANVAGDIWHKGFSEIVRAQSAVVEGTVHRGDLSEDESSSIEWYMLFLSVIGFSVLSAYFVGRNVLGRMLLHPKNNFGMYGLIGIGAFILTPIIAIVFLTSIIGSVVGVALLMGYVTLVISAYIFGVILLGHLFQKVVLKRGGFSLYTPILGAVLFSVVALLPGIGAFIMFATTLVSLGLIVHTIYQRLRG